MTKATHPSSNKSFKMSQWEVDQMEETGITTGMEVIRRGINLAIEMEEALSEGLSLGICLTKGDGVAAEIRNYHPSNDLKDPELDPKKDSHKLRNIPKAWPFTGETLAALEHLSGYDRYKTKRTSELLRFAIRVGGKFHKKRRLGHALVAVDQHGYTREIRIKGFPALLPKRGNSDEWQRRFASEDGRRLLACYSGNIDRKTGEVANVFGFEPDPKRETDSLFLAQSIFSIWHGKSAKAVAFANSETFKQIIERIRSVRIELFEYGQHTKTAGSKTAKAAAKRLHALSPAEQMPHSRVDNGVFSAIHEFFKEDLANMVADSTLIGIENHGDSPSNIDQFHAAMNMKEKSELRDLVRLWQYETLDCRAAWWIELNAMKAFKRAGGNTHSPFVVSAFRILSRVADNVQDKKDVFKKLHGIDLKSKASRLETTNSQGESTTRKWVDVRQCRDLVGLNEELRDNNAAQPFLIGRDQMCRDALLGELIKNELNESGLEFRYEAYEVNDGAVRTCWSTGKELEELNNSGISIDELAKINDTIDNMIDWKIMNNSFEARLENSGYGVFIELEGQGSAVVCQTLRRVCTIVVTGDVSLANQAMGRILETIALDHVIDLGVIDPSTKEKAVS